MSAAWGLGLLAAVVGLFSVACRFYHRAVPPAWTRHESIAVGIALVFAAGVFVSAGFLFQYVAGLEDATRGPVLLTGLISMIAVMLFWRGLARRRRKPLAGTPDMPPFATAENRVVATGGSVQRHARVQTRRKAA
jgi:hypothetical protein